MNSYIPLVTMDALSIAMTSWWARWRLKSPASRLILHRLFTRGSKKRSKLHVTGLCEGNSCSPVPLHFGTKWRSHVPPVYRRNRRKRIREPCHHLASLTLRALCRIKLSNITRPGIGISSDGMLSISAYVSVNGMVNLESTLFTPTDSIEISIGEQYYPLLWQYKLARSPDHEEGSHTGISYSVFNAFYFICKYIGPLNHCINQHL